jgi:hypothetical protein
LINKASKNFWGLPTEASAQAGGKGIGNTVP